jgi:hypothetical protein
VISCNHHHSIIPPKDLSNPICTARSPDFLTTSINNNTTHKTIIERRRRWKADASALLHKANKTSPQMHIFSSLGIMTGHRRTGRERGAYSPKFGRCRQPRLDFLTQNHLSEKNLFFSKKSVVRAPAQTSRRMWVNGSALGTWGRPFLSRFDRIACLQVISVYTYAWPRTTCPIV